MAEQAVETSASSTSYTLADCKKHNTDKDCWLIVHGKVYDVTNFLEEHPGGYDIIVTASGRDATQDFDEIGHSKSAKQLLEKYLIGMYEGGDAAPPSKSLASSAATPTTTSHKSGAMRTFHVVLPFLILCLALLLNYYGSKDNKPKAAA